MTILAFDANRRTNAQAIADAHELGYINDDDDVIDMTYGPKAAFWNIYRPAKLTTNDLDPKVQSQWGEDFRRTRWVDARWDVVVFDPPYAFRGTSKHAMDAQYGLGEYLSVDERLKLMGDGLKEAARLVKPKGYVLVKLQDQVVSGEKVWQRILMAIVADSLNLDLVDELHVAGYRAQPQRKCRVCGGEGTQLVDSLWEVGVEGGLVPVPCGVCGGSGKVDMVQKHSASNVSTLQIYRKVQ